MLNLSNIAKIEANKLASDGAWLILLEIQLSQGTIYIVRNTENITWNSKTWIAFPFELDAVEQNTDGEIPTVDIKVSNVTRALQYYIEEGDGAVDSSVVLRVVHSKNLTSTTPELEETFTIQNTKYDAKWVTFTLGGANRLKRREPQERLLRDFCHFKFKGVRCKYSGTSYTTCNHTFSDCKLRGNQARYGGEPSIPMQGLYSD